MSLHELANNNKKEKKTNQINKQKRSEINCQVL